MSFLIKNKRREVKTVPCIYCGQETEMLGTKMCDACWSAANSIRHIPKEVIMKIVKDFLD